MTVIRIALYQPDIPQNAGAILRLAACLAVPVDVVEPCGFLWDDRRLRRAGMDYAELARVTRHSSWDAYLTWRAEARPGRLVLLTTRGATPLPGFRFEPGDTLLLGRESAGVPDSVHATADARVIVPMAAGARSLNVAMTAALVAGEAVRQLDGWPATPQAVD